jgi:hypothetical protein
MHYVTGDPVGGERTTGRPTRAGVQLFDDERHVRPAWIRSSIVLSLIGAMTVAVLLWLWLSLSDTDARVLLSCAVVWINLFALLAGNFYRLRLIRKRAVAAAGDQLGAVLRQYPSLEMIMMRIRLSWAGIGLGSVAVFLAIAINTSDEITMSVVVAFLVLASSLASGIAGTLVRPLD